MEKTKTKGKNRQGDKMKDLFTTHITFTDGAYIVEEPTTDIKATILRLCEGPISKFNVEGKPIIKEAIIVDAFDMTVAEIKGRDVVFPESLAVEQRKYRETQTNKENINAEN